MWLFRPSPNGGTSLPENIGPGKPALLISSSCIGKAVSRAVKPTRLAGWNTSATRLAVHQRQGYRIVRSAMVGP